MFEGECDGRVAFLLRAYLARALPINKRYERGDCDCRARAELVYDSLKDSDFVDKLVMIHSRMSNIRRHICKKR